MELEWNKYKGFIDACFDRIFKNYKPIEEKVENGEFTPNMILDWDEDNYVLCYVNKSLDGYTRDYIRTSKKPKHKYCEVCGTEINSKSKNKYCKLCAKEKIKERDRKRKK